MKKIKAIICAVLSACVIAVPLVSSMSFNVKAEEKTVQERLEELEAKSAEYQAILDDTASDISDKEAYSTALVNKISVMNEKVILTKESIEEINKSIESKQAEIEKGNTDIDEQVDALCERLSIIYMAGSASNLEILLGAKDFGDFIDKITLVKTLSDYDKEMIEKLNGKLDMVEDQKKNLEAEKTKLEKEQEKLKTDLADLNKLYEENKAVLAELTKKNENAKAALNTANSRTAELEAEAAKNFAQQEEAAQAQAAVQAQIAKQRAAEQQKQQAQQAQQAQQSGGSGSGSSGGSDSSGGTVTPSGSGYTWPCPGYYFLSSLWNEDRTTYNHGAIDIAGGDILGAVVVAAESGTVADTCTYCTHNWGKDMSESCGCGGGYGNYVWIEHGNGKETIYAHLTTVVVSPGQTVTKGQVIGYVGTTGHSTGPHLHFECRFNGEKYNPMDELSAYWGMVSF